VQSGQLRSALESPSEAESMNEPELNARNNNAITTTALRFDNSLDWCHHRHRRGRLEVAMGGSIIATRCSGRRPTVENFRDSISSSGSSFARIHAALRQTLFNSEASLRHASVLSRSSGEIRGSDDVPDHRKFLIQKVLRFWQKGRSSSPRLARISSDFLFGNSLAVKGGALIHGPCLVARSVGSEWRTRLPYQIDIQFNQFREKQCIVI
jgi:hypothetical protein